MTELDDIDALLQANQKTPIIHWVITKGQAVLIVAHDRQEAIRRIVSTFNAFLNDGYTVNEYEIVVSYESHRNYPDEIYSIHEIKGE